MRDSQYKMIEANLQQAIEFLNKVEDFSNQTILSKDVLNAAALCKIYDELAFADFKAKCKSHKEVALTLFNEAVRKHTSRLRKEFGRFEENNSKVIKLNPANEDIFNLPPLPNGLELMIPPAYTCSTRGIVVDKVMANGGHITKFVAYSPFFIVERLKNIDDKTEKFKVAVYTTAGWHFITADRYDFSEEHRLVTLSRYGLGVDSVIARDTITYVSELLRHNLDKIPVTRIVSKIGWRNEFKEFIYPPNGRDYVVDTGENDELNLMYQTKGSRQKWLNHYDKIKIYPHARLAFAAALSAVFVEIIGMRNMTLCIWGKSGGGKTAGVIKFPMSIYGDPKYVPTFNSTFNSLERRAVSSNNLPFAVDELQNITNQFQRDNIDKFAHIVGEGVSKGRTAKNGELEVLKRFSTIALITGEQPLTGFNSDQGKKRRTVEFHCCEVLPRELADETHEFVNDNYGLIGREWVDTVKDHINDIKTTYKFFKKDFKGKRPETIPDHINFLAAAYTADVIFNVYFRNVSTNAAIKNLQEEHTPKTLNELACEEDTSNSQRAKAFIREFISSRRKHFLINNDMIKVQDPIFGTIKGDHITVYQYKLKSELKRAGFSPEKIINELIHEGFLESDADNISNRYKVNWKNTQPN